MFGLVSYKKELNQMFGLVSYKKELNQMFGLVSYKKIVESNVWSAFLQKKS